MMQDLPEEIELEDFPRTESCTDGCGRVRRFRVELHTADGGYFLRASEEGAEAAGYAFAAHSETSPYLALGRLRQRISEGLATRYLVREDGRRRLGHDRAAGRIGYGSVVIDGEDVSFEEFNEMIQSYEGWHFSLRIADPYEAI